MTREKFVKAETARQLELNAALEKAGVVYAESLATAAAAYETATAEARAISDKQALSNSIELAKSMEAETAALIAEKNAEAGLNPDGSAIVVKRNGKKPA